MDEARIELRTSPVGIDQRHSYLIFRNEAGQEFTIRGGPSRGDGLGDAALNTLAGADQFGQIRMDAQRYALIPGQPRPIDWPRPGETHESVVLWTGTDAQLQEKWDTAIKTAGQINAAQFEYSPLTNNCNNAATTVLRSIGITPQRPLGQDGKPVDAPAFDKPLFQDVGPMGYRSGYSFDGTTWLDKYGKPMEAPTPGKVFEPDTKKEFNSTNFTISQNEPSPAGHEDRQYASIANPDVRAVYNRLDEGLSDKLNQAGAGAWRESMLAETAYACVRNGINAGNIGYMDINTEKNNILVASQDQRQFAVINAIDAAKANPQERLDQTSQLQESMQVAQTTEQQQRQLQEHNAPGRTLC